MIASSTSSALGNMNTFSVCTVVFCVVSVLLYFQATSFSRPGNIVTNECNVLCLPMYCNFMCSFD